MLTINWSLLSFLVDLTSACAAAYGAFKGDVAFALFAWFTGCAVCTVIGKLEERFAPKEDA